MTKITGIGGVFFNLGPPLNRSVRRHSENVSALNQES
jgi:hypothetical protein